MPRPIEAVVFDLDGVLIDSEPIWRRVERDVFAGLGIELSDQELLIRNFHHVIRDTVAAHQASTEEVG